jgi:hypothetical protein
VTAAQYKWPERGLQKALSHLAHARAYNALHKKYIDAGDRFAAATLLSTAAPGAMAWVTFNDLSHKPVTLSRDNFRTAMRFSLGIDLPNLTVAAENQTACGHCGSSFPSAKHYQVHALVEKGGSAGGSMYGSHNIILEAVAEAARDAGVAYSVGTTVQGRRTQHADCRVGTIVGPDGTHHDKFADIVFPDMTACGYRAQRVYGDTTLRNVIGLHHNNLTAVHRAHSRPGAALQHAVALKTKMYNEAMRGRLNEEVAILAIETGGRMHSQFHRLITAFARFKADKIAGPLPANARQGVGYDDSTDPAVKAHRAIYVRTKSSLMGRIQVARVKTIAERIMRITMPLTRCTGNEAVSN